MNKIPNLCIVLNFAVKTPSQLITLSHVNNIFRESIEFYCPLLWERFVKAKGNSSPELKISLLHTAAMNGLEWVVHRLLQTASEVDHHHHFGTNNSSSCDENTISNDERRKEKEQKTSILSNLINAKESRYSSPTLGYSALMIASWRGKSVEVVRTLLSFGANVLMTDLLGKCSIELACEGGHHEILDLLLQQKNVTPDGRANFFTNTEVVPLRFCILYNRVKCAEILIKKYNCDLTQVDNIGRSILYQAARQGCFEITKMICEKCPRRSLFLKDPEGRRPIDAARAQGHNEVVKILAEAMVVVGDDDGGTKNKRS